MDKEEMPQEEQEADAPANEVRLCKVQGCTRDMGLEKAYYKRYYVCSDHLRSLELLVDGRVQRFCQQCGKFQNIEEFDDTKRSCRKQLTLHSQRRRFKLSQRRLQRQQEAQAENAAGEQAQAAAFAARMRHPGAEPPLNPLQLLQRRQQQQQLLHFDALTRARCDTEGLGWGVALGRDPGLNVGLALEPSGQDSGSAQAAGGRQEPRRTGVRSGAAAATADARSSGSPERRAPWSLETGPAGSFCLDLEQRPNPGNLAAAIQHAAVGVLGSLPEAAVGGLVSIARSGSSNTHAWAGGPAAILVAADGGGSGNPAGSASHAAPPPSAATRPEWPKELAATATAALTSGSQLQQQQPRQPQQQEPQAVGVRAAVGAVSDAVVDGMGGWFRPQEFGGVGPSSTPAPPNAVPPAPFPCGRPAASLEGGPQQAMPSNATQPPQPLLPSPSQQQQQQQQQGQRSPWQLHQQQQQPRQPDTGWLRLRQAAASALGLGDLAGSGGDGAAGSGGPVDGLLLSWLQQGNHALPASAAAAAAGFPARITGGDGPAGPAYTSAAALRSHYPPLQLQPTMPPTFKPGSSRPPQTAQQPLTAAAPNAAAAVAAVASAGGGSQVPHWPGLYPAAQDAAAPPPCLKRQTFVQDVRLENELTAMLDELVAEKTRPGELEQLRNLGSGGSWGSGCAPGAAGLSGSQPGAIANAGSGAGGNSGISYGSDGSAVVAASAVGGVGFAAGAGVGGGGSGADRARLPSSPAAAVRPAAVAECAGMTPLRPLPPPPQMPSPTARSMYGRGGNGGGSLAVVGPLRYESYGSNGVAYGTGGGTGAAVMWPSTRQTAFESEAEAVSHTPAVHDIHVRQVPSAELGDLDGFKEQQEPENLRPRYQETSLTEGGARNAPAPGSGWQAGNVSGLLAGYAANGADGGRRSDGGDGGSMDIKEPPAGTAADVLPWQIVSPFVWPQGLLTQPPTQLQGEEQYSKQQYKQRHGLQQPQTDQLGRSATQPLGAASGPWQAGPHPAGPPAAPPAQSLPQQYYQPPAQTPLEQQQLHQRGFASQDQPMPAGTDPSKRSNANIVRHRQHAHLHQHEGHGVMHQTSTQPQQVPYQQALPGPAGAGIGAFEIAREGRTTAVVAPAGGGSGGSGDAMPLAPRVLLQDLTLPYHSGQLLQRLSLKLYGCSPADLMPDSRARLQNWLASMNLQMLQFTVRSGCAHLIADVLVPVSSRGTPVPADAMAQVGLTGPGAHSDATCMVGHAGSKGLVERPGDPAGGVAGAALNGLKVAGGLVPADIGPYTPAAGPPSPANPSTIDGPRHQHPCMVAPTAAAAATVAAAGKAAGAGPVTPAQPTGSPGWPDNDSWTPASVLLRRGTESTEDENSSSSSSSRNSQSNRGGNGGSHGYNDGSSSSGGCLVGGAMECLGVGPAARAGASSGGGGYEELEIQLLLRRLCGGGGGGSDGGGGNGNGSSALEAACGGEFGSSLQVLLGHLLGPLYGRPGAGGVEGVGQRLLLQLDQQVVQIQWPQTQVGHGSQGPSISMRRLGPDTGPLQLDLGDVGPTPGPDPSAVASRYSAPAVPPPPVLLALWPPAVVAGQPARVHVTVRQSRTWEKPSRPPQAPAAADAPPRLIHLRYGSECVWTCEMDCLAPLALSQPASAHPALSEPASAHPAAASEGDLVACATEEKQGEDTAGGAAAGNAAASTPSSPSSPLPPPPSGPQQPERRAELGATSAAGTGASERAARTPPRKTLPSSCTARPPADAAMTPGALALSPVDTPPSAAVLTMYDDAAAAAAHDDEDDEDEGAGAGMDGAIIDAVDGEAAGSARADNLPDLVLSLDLPALPAPGLAFVESSCGEVLGPWLPLLAVPSKAMAAELAGLVRQYGTRTGGGRPPLEPFPSSPACRPPLEPFLVDLDRLLLLDGAGSCLEEAGYTEDWESYVSYCELREAMPDALLAAGRVLRKCMEWQLTECANLVTRLFLDLLREPS